MALGDYEKTTYVNGQAPGLSAQNLNKNENKTEELDNALATHLAEKATDEDLGHVQIGDGINVDENGLISHPTGAGNNHIPSGGVAGQCLVWKSDGEAGWGSGSPIEEIVRFDVSDTDVAQVSITGLDLTGYSDVILLGQIAPTQNSAVKIRFNNQSSNIYYNGTVTPEPNIMVNPTLQAGTFGGLELKITNTLSRMKIVKSRLNADGRTASASNENHAFNSTTDITSIQILLSTGNIIVGSSFVLLGVKR